MATDISIAFKASDKLSDSIRGMQKNVKSLSKDIGEYRQIAEQAFDKKKEISLDITKAKTELKALEKAVKQGDETAEKGFKEKRKHLDLLQEEYKRLGRVVQDAGKAEKSLADDISRNSNRYASRNAPDLANSLKNAGLGAMLGNATSGLLGQIVTSGFGATTGSAISDIAGGMATGAAMGSLGGPVAAGIGAAVGGLTGAINTLTKHLEKKDDIFREEVKGVYTDIKGQQQQELENGINLFTKREQDVGGISTLLGSDEKGNKLFEDINQFGLNTPYYTNNMVESSKTMLAYGVDRDKLIDDIHMLGEVAMGDQAKFDGLSYVYAQTKSAGKLTGQDLLQYTGAGFNPLTTLGEERGKSQEEMRELMGKGLISADDVTHAFKIVTSEGGNFFGAMAKQMETYGGKMTKLSGLKNELDISYGEGFAGTRKTGIDKEIEEYGGEMGEEMREAYNLIGQFEADLENKHQQAIIDSIRNAEETQEYKNAFAEEDGAGMGRIIAKAKAKAEVEYKNSEEYEMKLDADLQLVEDVQQAVSENGTYLDYGKKMGEQFSKGFNGAVLDKLKIDLEERKEKGQGWVEENPEFSDNYRNKFYRNGNGHATGLDRVPHDDYFAKLHEGERVLTRLQADEMDRKTNRPPVNINLTVNAKTGDPYELAQVLYSEIKNAMENLVDNS